MDEYDRCPVTDILRLVSDRWSLVTLVLLGRRSYRFNELHRSIEGVSQRMLTRTLRNLEAGSPPSGAPDWCGRHAFSLFLSIARRSGTCRPELAMMTTDVDMLLTRA